MRRPPRSTAREFALEVYRLLLEVVGQAGYLAEGSPGAVLRGRLENQARSQTIFTFGGGTNEIQRDIIAWLGLGLPGRRAGAAPSRPRPRDPAGPCEVGWSRRSLGRARRRKEPHVDDEQVIARITALADEERQLEEGHVGDGLVRRGPRPPAGHPGPSRPTVGPARQRRALRDAGQDPDRAAERPVDTVEGYRQ